MAEQVCPHCRKSITEQDMNDFSKKLQEEAIEKEFRDSPVYRKIDKLVLYFGVGGFTGTMLTTVLIAFLDRDMKFFTPMGAIFMVSPMLISSVILKRLVAKQSNLRDQFMQQRLS